MKQMVRTVKRKETPRDADDLTAEERERGMLVRALAAHFRNETADHSETIQRMVRDPSLGPRHVRLLYELRDAPLSVGEVAARLGVELSTASQLAGELRRAGIVRAQRDRRDARRVVLSMRGRVRTEVAEFMERRVEPLRAAIASLSEREAKAFLKGLRAWVDALGVRDPMG
jgi:DNA-binding MarR family transcriptional regulator